MGSILSHLETPVAIVTARAGEREGGMTAAWITQVSFTPPLLAVSIAPERFTHKLIEESGAFAVNLLRAGQESIAKDLGFRSGRAGGKLAAYELLPGKTGSPLLSDAGAYYDCRVVDRVTTGDHTLFVGEVVAEGVLKGGPYLPFVASVYFG